MRERCRFGLTTASAVALLASRVFGEPSTTARASAQELLQRMAQTYSSCRSYQDKGTVALTFKAHTPPHIDEWSFRTAFVRPGEFRLDFESGRGRETNTIWRHGSTVLAKWSGERTVERLDSLSSAVAGATGISSGVAHTVPALLMPEDIGGWRLTELQDVVRLENDRLGEASCLRLRGVGGEGLPVTVWLDSETYLIRRIDEELPERFGAVQATLYEPAADGAVGVVPLEAPKDTGGFPGLVVGPAVVVSVLLVVWWRRKGALERRTRRSGNEAADQEHEAGKA